MTFMEIFQAHFLMEFRNCTGIAYDGQTGAGFIIKHSWKINNISKRTNTVNIHCVSICYRSIIDVFSAIALMIIR